LRKTAGLSLSDRIHTTVQVTGDGADGTADRVRAALARFGGYIQQETLSLALADATPPAGAHTGQDTYDGVDLLLSVQRTG
jgi:hypothetical protein